MYPVATQLICSITSIVTIGYITLLRGNLGLNIGVTKLSHSTVPSTETSAQTRVEKSTKITLSAFTMRNPG